MQTDRCRIAPLELRLDEVITYWASIHPKRPVLISAECNVSMDWGEFELAIAQVALKLKNTISTGTPVGVISANSLDFHVLLNALWRIGAGVVLLDRNWGPAIVADILSLLGCKNVFVSDSTTTAFAKDIVVQKFPNWDTTQAAISSTPTTYRPEQIALYATTSGTTDNPKCVAITHNQIRTAYRNCLSIHDFSNVKCGACLFDINSLGVLGVCFLLLREVGACTRQFSSFSLLNVRSIWNSVLNENIDFVYLVPPLVRLLNTLPLQSYAREVKLLSFCSAAPISEKELRGLESIFPLRVFNCYGLTELTFAVFFGCRADNDLASDSIGTAVGISARLVDANGDTLEGPGQGELYITGPMQTGYYVNNARATEDSWDKGWLKTGDIAERDQNNRYYIRGRIKDVVFRGGNSYFLHELEYYLRLAPEIVDACAFKGRDLPSGDELCVLVQANVTVSSSILMHWIRDNLGPTKVPNALYVTQRGLPRNSNGKVMRNSLSIMHLDGTLKDWIRDETRTLS